MTRKLLLAAIMSLTMLNLHAQEDSSPVTYGVRLDMDISIPGGGSDIYQTGAGFSLGGIAQIAMPKKFYFEPGLFFSYTGMTAKNLITFDDEYYYEGAAKYYGLRVPLYLATIFQYLNSSLCRWQWGRMSISIYMHVSSCRRI